MDLLFIQYFSLKLELFFSVHLMIFLPINLNICIILALMKQFKLHFIFRHITILVTIPIEFHVLVMHQ